MNAHCGLWQRECDLNTRMRESKSLALPLGYRAISQRAVSSDAQHHTRKESHNMNTCRILQRLGLNGET